MFDVLGKITKLRTDRNWTVYRLSKLSGIPQSTIATWYQKNLMPPVDKIEILCDTFGISLADFFKNGSIEELTQQQMELIGKWNLLEKNQRQAVIQIINLLLCQAPP